MATQKATTTAGTNAGGAQPNLRKIARALNARGWQRGRSFYWLGGKFTQARVSKGVLQIRFCSNPWLSVRHDYTFGDGSGSVI